MPIATLTFTLPEEQEAFEDAQRAGAYQGALVDLAQAFRSHRKYDAVAVTEEMFFEILREHDVVIG